MYTIKMEDGQVFTAESVVYGVNCLYAYCFCNDGITVQTLSTALPYGQIEFVEYDGKKIM